MSMNRTYAPRPEQWHPQPMAACEIAGGAADVLTRCKQLKIMLLATPGHLPLRHGGIVTTKDVILRTEDCAQHPSAGTHALLAVDGQGRFRPAGVCVSPSVLDELNKSLQDESGEVRCASCWMAPLAFVYCDISDFSQHEPVAQVAIMNAMQRLETNPHYWQVPRSVPDGACLDRICIGDGFIWVFQQAYWATYFAARLACLLDEERERDRLPGPIHYRMAVHYDDVLRFWDERVEEWNYLGFGITGGRRVLEAAGRGRDDVVYLSDQAKRRLIKERDDADPDLVATYTELLEATSNIGRRRDKHREYWRIHMLNHFAVADDESPPKEDPESPFS